MNYYDTANHIINAGYGISSTYLALKLMSYINPGFFSKRDMLAALDKLVNEDEIVQLMFTIRGENQVIYFPKGTTICQKPNDTLTSQQS